MQIAGGGLQKKKVEDMPWSSLVGVRKLLKGKELGGEVPGEERKDLQLLRKVWSGCNCRTG
jgi:hypothetical protein